MRTDQDADRGVGSERRRTAAMAILAGIPCLVLTAFAAATSTALTLKADMALTLLDTIVLVTAWHYAARPSVACGRVDRGETIACALAAFSMTLSMAIVAAIAIHRLATGGLAPEGAGLVFGMSVNLAYAAVNLFILMRWRRRHRAAPSALSRSQVCLFCDKLASNLLIGLSIAAALAFEGRPFAAYIDPAAGLLIAASTARWTLPVFRDALHGLRARSARAEA
jgi:Co/Zn/Cd efflux system component